MTAILRHRITPAEFVNKWRPVTLTERAAAQEHFIDLCRLFDHPTPVEEDPTGVSFTFEKGVTKAGGGQGFADVWKRGFFAWEYKKRHRDLDAALGQLSRYALALENPPLQVACDTDRFRIITAYTNSVPRSYDLTLDEMLDNEKRAWLEAVFYAPVRLKPGAKRSDITKQAADKFSTLAQRLQAKNHIPEDVAHFINRLVFLFFAEDVGLLKDGFFRRTVTELAGRPSEAKDLLSGLFLTLRKGGRFGLDRLPWINGGLFDDREALPLDEHEIGLLKAASSQDWAHIDPTIFGTLFERFLDPGKRAQIGAHYTDAGKIGQIIEPVVLRPLREEWRVARADIQAMIKKASANGAKSNYWQRAEERRSVFLERLRTLSILDPACGSGNFLYLALHGVKDLEHAANQECESMGLPPRLPLVGPEILRGIEINPLAAELARTTIWIGDIQWAIQNGIRTRPEPILRRLDSIECRDALLDGAHQAAAWPKAEMIIGNPPFLGTKKMLSGLGAPYTKALRNAYKGRVSSFSDIVCWWFYRGLEQLEAGHARRVGLVATNSIRGGKNREALDQITTQAHIYDAWSDEPWLLDGASVRVSIICYSKEERAPVLLDGKQVSCINSDLTEGEGQSTSDLTQAKGLRANDGIAFNGIVKGGKFEVPGRLARSWVQQPLNANKRSNIDVVRPWKSGDDITSHDRDLWLIDFGNMSEDEACYFDAPFKWVCDHVKSYRTSLPEKREKHYWWQLSRPGTSMKASLVGKPSYIAIPEVSKHQMAVMMQGGSIPDKNLVVIGVEDYSLFGILSSKYHRAWARRLGTSLEDRPRYTSSTTFRTFPFPESFFPGTTKMPLGPNTQGYTINEAAEKLHTKRCDWIYPEDTFKWVADVDSSLPKRAILKKGKSLSDVKGRTITELYNKNVLWVTKLHQEVDRAVAAAYGWPEDISTEDALAALLEMNRQRAAAQGKA